MRVRCLCAGLVFALLATLPAAAQIGKHGPQTSITISPLHLPLPVVEVMSEFKMQPKVGVAGIVGLGSVDGAFVFELGGQAQYYLIGDFDHGMQGGVEMIYAHAGDESNDGSISATSNGLALGSYLGYKVAFAFGLTLNIQGGLDLLLVRAHAEDSSGASGSASGSVLFPLVNFNVGWSF